MDLFSSLPSINGAARRFLICALSGATTCAGVVVYAQEPTFETSQYRAESHAFLVAYLKGSDSMHYHPRASFAIPAVWLFAPDGKLISITDDASQLPRLDRPFPPQSAQALPDEPSLQIMERVLGDATGGTVSLHSSSSRWTALLFTGDANQCKHCSVFEKAAHDLQLAHASQLRMVSLFVN